MIDGPAERLDRSGRELVFAEDFAAPQLDESRWVPHHLPQGRPRALGGAVRAASGVLRRRIDAAKFPSGTDRDPAAHPEHGDVGAVRGYRPRRAPQTP